MFKGGGLLAETFQGIASVILTACPATEKARELDTLDGGAGFLSWMLINACGAHFREVSPDEHSLSLNDIWEHKAKFLEEANQTLQEGPFIPEPQLEMEIQGVAREIWFTETKRSAIESNRVDTSLYDREEYLRALITDHSHIIRDKLSSFVGRHQELTDLHHLIAEVQQTGGYVTIQGLAG